MFASAIYDQNAKLVDAGLTPVNLSSVMIGACEHCRESGSLVSRSHGMLRERMHGLQDHDSKLVQRAMRRPHFPPDPVDQVRWELCEEAGCV